MASLQQIGKTATTVRVIGDWLYVTYHGTDVVRANLDTREVKLRTGGYRTLTTKTRMNQAANQFDLGFSVQQVAGDWYITIKDTGQTIPFDKDEIAFKTSRAGYKELLQERNRTGLSER